MWHLVLSKRDVLSEGFLWRVLKWSVVKPLVDITSMNKISTKLRDEYSTNVSYMSSIWQTVTVGWKVVKSFLTTFLLLSNDTLTLTRSIIPIIFLVQYIPNLIMSFPHGNLVLILQLYNMEICEYVLYIIFLKVMSSSLYRPVLYCRQCSDMAYN